MNELIIVFTTPVETATEMHNGLSAVADSIANTVKSFDETAVFDYSKVFKHIAIRKADTEAESHVVVKTRQEDVSLIMNVLGMIELETDFDCDIEIHEVVNSYRTDLYHLKLCAADETLSVLRKLVSSYDQLFDKNGRGLHPTSFDIELQLAEISKTYPSLYFTFAYENTKRRGDSGKIFYAKGYARYQ